MRAAAARLPAQRSRKQRFAELVADTGPQNFPTTGSAFTSPFSTARRRGADAILEGRRRQVRNAVRACAKQWRGPAARSTATPGSYTSSGWSQRARSEVAQRIDCG